jgi:hypothetical protein
LQLKLNAKSHRDGGIPGIPRLLASTKTWSKYGPVWVLVQGLKPHEC